MDTWTEFAKLEFSIYCATASILNNRFIYLFGGNSNSVDGFLNTIQYFDIKDDKPKWIEHKCKLYNGLCFHNSITISPTEILIFGGRSFNNANTESFTFNGFTNSISERAEMPET